MRRIVVTTACILALLQVSAADAQTLYKCASKAGNSYQQLPCAGSARTVSAMDVAPEPPPTASQLAVRARKAEQDRAESAFLSHLAGTDQPAFGYRGTRYRRSSTEQVRRNAHSDACGLAKATRTATLQAVGLGRTYDLLRRLDDAVANACSRG